MPNSRLECKNQTLLMIKMDNIDTPFMTKTTEKSYPLGPPHTHLYTPYRGVPPPWASDILDIVMLM